MDGETPMASEREPGWTLAGKVRSKEVSVPAASDPPCACDSLTPGMLMGRSNSMASDSSSVRALPVTVAVWTCAGADAPLDAGFAAAGNGDFLGLALQDVEPLDVERDTRGFGVGEVVVDQRGDHHLIALHEESRHHQAQDEVLAHDGLEDGAPTLVSGVAPRAVARHVVRESGNSTLARAWPAVSVTTSVAQKAVSGKALRILGSDHAVGFELGQAARRAQLGQLHAALAGFAVEEKAQRVVGVDAVAFAAEEKRQRIFQRVAADGVDGFVHHTRLNSARGTGRPSAPLTSMV
jgi:hypothetical protein